MKVQYIGVIAHVLPFGISNALRHHLTFKIPMLNTEGPNHEITVLSNFRFSVLIPSQLWDQTEITNDLISTLLLIFQGDVSV